jgi:hypothetical protein
VKPDPGRRAARLAAEHDESLVEFVGLLLDALDVPEVAAAVAAKLARPSPRPSPSPPGRGSNHTRSGGARR